MSKEEIKKLEKRIAYLKEQGEQGELVLSYSILSDLCKTKVETLSEEEPADLDKINEWKKKADEYKQLFEESRAELMREQRKRRGNGDMDVAFDRIESLETIVSNIRKYIQTEQDKQAKDMFIILNSPLERMPLFKKLDTKIRQIDERVSFFRTTESGLVYEINDRVFVTIYPQVNALKVEYAIPDGWDSCHLTNDSEIDGAMVLVEESCEFIKKKKK